MAMYFGEILEPSTRALLDDDHVKNTNELRNLQLLWKHPFSENIKFNKFLVVANAITLAFVEAHILNEKHQIVGEIRFSSLSDSKNNKVPLPATSTLIIQGELLICFVHPSFPAFNAFEFADLVSSLCQSAQEVTILTSQSLSSYKQAAVEGQSTSAVYALASSSYKSTPRCPRLAPANIVTGAPGAVASWCEINGVAAVVYVYYSESEVLDSLSSKPLLELFPQRESYRARRRLDLDKVELEANDAACAKSEIVHSGGSEEQKEIAMMGDSFVLVDGIVPGDSLVAADGECAQSGVTVTVTRTRSDRDKKLGHRRVREDGLTTYKKVQTSQIMGSIQLGIQHAVGGLASKPERDLLMQDFMTVETYNFPSMGSSHTPAHHFSEFRFKNYAPIAFRYFRELFGIQPDDFLISMCYAPLCELSNPGASGSVFYVTDDDELIIKTVQHKEGEFLQKLLPGYYMNLNQNPRTLLPKFFGLYCYQLTSKNIRLVVMNNLLPSHVTMHQKYDLKGSTYKRKSSKAEREKKSPTFKDLDFMEHHPEGLYLDPDTYGALMKTIQRDCRVLESFKIMDYSLLVGVHNQDVDRNLQGLVRSRSIRQRVMTHATPMESIQAEGELEDELPSGGIPAKNAKGDRLVLYLGIIDILQSYKFKKMLEHTWKALIHDGDTVSVHRPDFYAQRFQDFMAKRVFRKMPNTARSSVWKRRSLGRTSRQETPRAATEPEAPNGVGATESTSYTSGFGSLALTNSNSASGNSASDMLLGSGPHSAHFQVHAEIVRHVTTIHVEN